MKNRQLNGQLKAKNSMNYFIQKALFCVAVYLMFCTSYVYGYEVDIVEETAIELKADPGTSGSVEVRVMNEVFSAPRNARAEVILYKDEVEVERAHAELDGSGRAHLTFDVSSGKYVLKAIYEGDAWSSSSEASLEFEVPGEGAKGEEGDPAAEATSSEGCRRTRVWFIFGALCVIAAAFGAYRSRFALKRLMRRLGLARPAIVPMREVAKRVRAAKAEAVSERDKEPGAGDDVKGLPQEGVDQHVLREHVAECFEAVASFRGEQWGKMTPTAFAKKYAGELGEPGSAELRAFCERIERAAFDPSQATTLKEVEQIHKDAERLIRYF